MRLVILTILCAVAKAAFSTAPIDNLNALPTGLPDSTPSGSSSGQFDGIDIHIDTPKSKLSSDDLPVQLARDSNEVSGDSDPDFQTTQFFMCCQQTNTSAVIDNYYPPYACIFGPSTGVCPQVNSSFPFPWLCTLPEWWVGSFVSIYHTLYINTS